MKARIKKRELDDPLERFPALKSVTVLHSVREKGHYKSSYADLCVLDGKTLVVLGNTTHQNRKGVETVWAAHWESGDVVDAPVMELSSYVGTQPSLRDVVRRIELWARQGNASAMWWLGHFYEGGSTEVGANGGKALAYYVGAIRCKPYGFDDDAVERVLIDGTALYRGPGISCSDSVADYTPKNCQEILNLFPEYRQWKSHHHVLSPDSSDWMACIKIAESLFNG